MKKTLAPAGMEMTFLGVEEGLKTVQEAQASVDAVVQELGLDQQQ